MNRLVFRHGCRSWCYGGSRQFLSTIIDIDYEAPRTTVTSHAEQVADMPNVLTKFVTYPKEEFKRIMHPFLKPELTEQLSVFRDYSLLTRAPALNTIKDLMELSALQTKSAEKQTQDGATQPLPYVPRFVLYGQPGNGMSVILSQIAQFATQRNWLIFPFPNAERWLDRCVDLTHSNDYHQDQHRPKLTGEAFDFPSRSAQWLQLFLKLNESFLAEVKPVTGRDIEWTRVDVMRAGTTWLELINFATARTKYATDCVGILLREMRSLCSQPDGPACLLLVDGVNFLWCRGTRLKDKTLQCKVTTDRLAIVHHLQRALLGDWHRGAIVTALNIRGAWPTDREKYTPGYLLGKSGFDTMDPFIPVHVPGYTKAETDALLRFYAEHRWLTNPAAHTTLGRAEIEFLSDGNPLELDQIVAEW